MFDDLSGVEARRKSPITAYVGANGSGKSLLAVSDCLPSLESGRLVVSSVRLLDPDASGECEDESCDWPGHPNHRPAHPNWRPLLSWNDILEAEHCDLLLDEVTGIVSSRASSSLPGQIADVLVQLRRRDVVLRWTAPAWARADVLLRECTQAAVMSKGLFRRRAAGQDWPSSTWIRWKMVDARDLDELTQAQRLGTARNKLNVWARGFGRVAAMRGRLAYATLDAVSSLSSASHKGTCIVCGGRVAQPACSC